MAELSQNQSESVKKEVSETQGGGPQHVNQNALGSAVAHPQRSEQLETAKTTAYTRALKDITNEFKNAVKDLPIGSLVIQEDFSLFESVSAVEIMDPKMDSGFLAPGEALEDYYDTSSDLELNQVIGIIDQLICHEMAWHQGYPLARTLFTSHYIDKLLCCNGRQLEDFQFHKDFADPGEDVKTRPLVQVVLRAYCIGLIKSCGYVLEEVERSCAAFYEEEDFSMNTYGRQLLSSVPEAQVVAVLDSAIEWAEAQAKGSSSTESLPLWAGLSARIKMRKRMLVAVANSSGTALESWERIAPDLESITSSHGLGQPVPGAFSSKIQRRLASTAPLRPVVDTNFEDASKILSQLIADCIQAWSNTKKLAGTKDIKKLKAMLYNFTARKPEPLPYARACCYFLVTMTDAQNLEQWILSDISQLLYQDPASHPDNWALEAAPWVQLEDQDSKTQIAKVINDFAKVALEKPGGYGALFQAFCSNRSRLRRNLGHVLDGFESLQRNEAKMTDDILAKLSPDSMERPMATWTNHTKLQVVEMMIQLGFELDIYLPHEFAFMYLFLEKVSSARESTLIYLINTAVKRSFDKEDDEHLNHYIDELSITCRESRVTSYLARALSSLYSHLNQLRLIPLAPGSPYDDESRSFELRMKPFWNVDHPTLAQYTATLGLASPNPNNDGLEESEKRTPYEVTEKYVKKAKESASKLIELTGVLGSSDDAVKAFQKSLLASCIAVGISNAAVHKGAASMLKVEIPLSEKRYHPQWAVPKVTEG